jgi:hypothetical protein
VAFCTNSMSMVLVVGGFGSGVMGNHGTVRLKSSCLMH